MVELTKREARKFIEGNLLKYLMTLKLEGNLDESGKGHIRCLSDEHEDIHPSMYYKNNTLRCHCKACMNTFDVISKVNNIQDKQEVFTKACEIFDIKIVDVNEHCEADTEAKINNYNNDGFNNLHQKLSVREKGIDIDELMNKYISNRVDPDFRKYLNKRGIFKDSTINQFRLGYDNNHKFYNSANKKQETHKSIVVQNAKDSLVYRCIDDINVGVNRYDKLGKSKCFNIEALNKESKYIIVCEGEFDAISVYEAVDSNNIEAIALSSITNVNQFLEVLKSTLLTGKKETTFVIELDNDDAGIKARDELIEEFKKLNLDFVYDIDLKNGCKDINEALVNNRDEFFNRIKGLDDVVKQKKEEQSLQQLGEYKDKFNVGAGLYAYKAWLEQKHNEEVITTGFYELDKILGGGLQQGLYVIGGMPSAGKTAFLLQVADNIAQADKGVDALIFSLEMSRNELTTRSLSRLSYLTVADKTRKVYSPQDAFTYSMIVANKNNSINLLGSNNKIKLFEECVDEYSKKIANNLYVYEGNGDVTSNTIETVVNQHIKTTNHKVVVIIDYLQIMQSDDKYNIEKQAIDNNISSLKRLTNKFGIPILLVSSFNRDSYNKGGLASFKESGGIEYGCDVIFSLTYQKSVSNEDNLKKEQQKTPRAVKLEVLKNRNGVTRQSVDFNYYSAFHFFETVGSSH